MSSDPQMQTVTAAVDAFLADHDEEHGAVHGIGPVRARRCLVSCCCPVPNMHLAGLGGL